VYERLKHIVGEKNVSDNFFELVNNTLDALPYDFDSDRDVLPHAVVKPGDEKEISEIFRLANQ
jgi:FAD/FMN-containing dehydrogenase